MVEAPEPGTAPTKPQVCPECRDEFPDSRALAIHLERHREVKPQVIHPKTGTEVSKPCPQACGRHFMVPREYREHVPLCDGQAPLWKPPEGATAAQAEEVRRELERARRRRTKRRAKRMVDCEKCGKKFKDGRGLAGHRRSGCGAKGGTKEKGLSGPLGDILRKKAQEHREKAKEHEEAADKLETMAGDLDTLIE